MKRINKILLVLIAIWVVSACKESFLDQKYENSLVDVNFFTTPAHAEQAVIGVYDVLGFEGQYILTQFVLGSSTADDVQEDHGDFSLVGTGMIECDKYTWHSSSKYIMDRWFSSYKGIERANYVILKVPGIEGLDKSLADRYVAEAKVLRALFYYNLVTCYGDIPLFTKPITLDEAKVRERDPQAEVWKQIVLDLTEAVSVLPDKYGASDLGRVTKGFTNAFLSRVYLWTKEYDKAALVAQAVISSPAKYGLEPKYSDIFDGTVETGQESILDLMCASGGGQGNIFQTEISEVNRVIYWGPFLSWSHFMQTSRNFIDNAFEPGDLRKKASVLDMRAGDKLDMNNNGILTDDVIPANPPVDAHNMKYVPRGVDLTAGIWSAGGFQTLNIHIMRFSEVLLNLAEALNEQNKPSEALTYLNKVRNRAGLPSATSTNKTELANIILHERAVEFCFEGYRFFDLKRAGKLTEVLGPLGFVTGRNEVFPIPQIDIDLSKMKQNPGY